MPEGVDPSRLDELPERFAFLDQEPGGADVLLRACEVDLGVRRVPVSTDDDLLAGGTLLLDGLEDGVVERELERESRRIGPARRLAPVREIDVVERELAVLGNQHAAFVTL